MYMKRYQVYLNPDSVAVLDNIERIVNISRSKLIRGVVDRYANTVKRFIIEVKPVVLTKYRMDDLAGFDKQEAIGKTNFSETVDDIYHRDL